MYLTAEVAREQHQRDLEQAVHTRRALRVRALDRATRRVRRAERRARTARTVQARLHRELNS
jgi:hypothetical protein